MYDEVDIFDEMLEASIKGVEGVSKEQADLRKAEARQRLRNNQAQAYFHKFE